MPRRPFVTWLATELETLRKVHVCPRGITRPRGIDPERPQRLTFARPIAADSDQLQTLPTPPVSLLELQASRRDSTCRQQRLCLDRD
jgi:hypothetical protein